MNTGNSVPPVSGQPQQPPQEPHFIVNAVGQLTIGCVLGYIQYRFTKYFIDPTLTEAKPFILVNVCATSIMLSMDLAYRGALKIIGERTESDNTTTEQSLLGKFRSRTWKVIKTVENITERVDTVFSRIIKIRSEKEIADQKIDVVDLRLLEILRRAFKMQLKELVLVSAPFQVSASLVKSAGYMLPGTQLLLGWELLNFVMGIVTKTTEVYNQRIKILEEAEALNTDQR